MSILNYVSDELKEKYEKQSEEVGQAWKVTAKKWENLNKKNLKKNVKPYEIMNFWFHLDWLL